MRPAGKRAVVSHLVSAHGLSERRACRLAELNLSTWQYRCRGADRPGLRTRIRELAYERRRFGYRRIHALLRREGWSVNHKAVHRIYVEEGLQVRKRKRKRISQGERQPLAVPQAPGERWSMDFQHDMLASGRRFRTLNIVDDFSRACPAIEVDISLPGARVVRVLDRLAETRRLAHDHRSRQRPGDARAGARRMGLSKPRSLGFHRAWQAATECFCGILQRPVPGRVPERALVP